jgi:GH43 family beta-xylosidase
MTGKETTLRRERTYTNPVYDGYLGDPFVLKHNGEYYAYGTVPADRAVPVLHSRDLVNWRRLGDALTLRDTNFEALWAPEVAYAGGTFYMYYSAGGAEGEGHRLRVATAARPEGPFEDSGVVLTPDEPFSIDPHPFRDEDGQWHLYYCRDFLDPDSRVGTGIVADRLLDMTRLAGERRTVVRPHADWQLYERQRRWYGRVWDWYTVEGPFVRKHGGRYYCFYSGGAWKEPNYGVSYVVAEHPLGPFVPAARTDEPALLSTRPERAVGPGHASVVRAPDNLHDYIVYHAWDPGHTSRLMRIDPLEWDRGRPSTPAPTAGSQPAPPLPLFRDGFDGPDGAPPDLEAWRLDGGDWRLRAGELIQHNARSETTTARLINVPPQEGCLIELNARLVEAGDAHGRYGVRLEHGRHTHTNLALSVDGAGLVCNGGRIPLKAFGPGFDNGAYHQLLVSVRGAEAAVWVDGVCVASGLEVSPDVSSVALFTHGASAAFDGVSVTPLGPTAAR